MGVLSNALKQEADKQVINTATIKLNGTEFKVGAKLLTASDFAAVNRKLKVNFQSDSSQFDGQVDMIIRKTRIVDDEGCLTDEKAFDVSDKPYLSKLPVEILTDIFAKLFSDQITETDDDTNSKVDETKGNSKAIS